MKNYTDSPLSLAKHFPLNFFLGHLFQRLYTVDAPGYMYSLGFSNNQP